MNVFTSYEVATGRILAVYSLPESQTDPGPPMAGQAYHPGRFAADDFYFSGDRMMLRPESGIEVFTTDVRTVTIVNVPLGAAVTVTGAETVDQFDSDDNDGTIEYTMYADGSYTIQVESFPLRSFSATVTFP